MSTDYEAVETSSHKTLDSNGPTDSNSDDKTKKQTPPAGGPKENPSFMTESTS